MPEWSWIIWALILGGFGMATALGYDIERALRELRGIRIALEDIRADLGEVADEARSIKRQRRESEMLALGLDPSD